MYNFIRMNIRTPRKHRPYELSEYNPIWKEQYRDYSSKIKSILGDNLISIEHIGSTSIEGMVAKPQIDILVVVKNLDEVKNTYRDFIKAGYVPRGREYVGIGDEYVSLDSPDGKRLASVHIFPLGEPIIEKYRKFRDYLSTHEEDRELYIKTKRELYSKYKDNYEQYDLGKGGVINEIKQRIDRWLKD